MRSRFFTGILVASLGATSAILVATCSSAATTKAVVVPTTNQGLCKLVSPSVVATALNVSMMFPTTLKSGATTECVYRSKNGASTAVIIRYDTRSSEATFSKDKATFERRGQKLGSVTGLGDQAYYFDDQPGQATVTTVVVRRQSLQLLVTGSATLDPIGSIARYALNQYEVARGSGSS